MASPAPRKQGRPPKYDWEDKKEICWKLYNDERLTGSQIVDYFAKHFGIPKSELPASNQFHRKAPLPPDQEEKLLARIQELFSQNFGAKAIQVKLNDEGWDLDDYHFLAFRKKHGLLMRHNRGYQPQPSKGKKRQATDNAAVNNEEMEEANEAATVPHAYGVIPEDRPLPPLDPAEAARREQRKHDLEAASQELLQTRKRRRRIRGYGHMGPDPAGLEPRYSSETSLDECKAFLHLSNEMYNQIRDEFEAICKADGIIKMSTCAEGQWQNAKDRLVRQNPYLSAVLHPLQSDLEKKNIAVNCICMDVTKTMRSVSKQISMADANNILGLDPLQSKELRRIFYDILNEDHFTTVVACGNEHVDELRQQWYAKSDFLGRVMAEGDSEKIRAVKVLDRDCRKRFGDDRHKKAPQQKTAQKNYGPGPGPTSRTVRVHRGPHRTYNEGAPFTKAPGEAPAPNTNGAHDASNATASRPTEPFSTASRRTIAAVGPAWIGHQVPPFHSTTIADMVPPINFDIDPDLEQLGRPRTGPIWPPMASFDSNEREADPISVSNGRPMYLSRAVHNPAVPETSPTTVSAYFRLAPASQVIGHHPRMWLGKLSTRSMTMLHAAATARAGGATVRKVHGVVKNADGGEDSWLIENEDELEVYLGEAAEKATFVVELDGGYA